MLMRSLWFVIVSIVTVYSQWRVQRSTDHYQIQIIFLSKERCVCVTWEEGVSSVSAVEQSEVKLEL